MDRREKERQNLTVRDSYDENANHIVQKINQIIPIVAYVTARPKTIKDVTKQWLKKYNFPHAPIIMSPDSIKIEGRSEWKAKVIETLFPEVVGIIDDNPEFLGFLSKDYQGTIFLYDNVEFEKSLSHIIPCPTWDGVYKEVRQRFENTV